MSGTPSDQDMTLADNWGEALCQPPSEEGSCFPVDFRYGGRESSSLLQRWTVQRTEEDISTQHSRQRALSLIDPESGLQCRCEFTLFNDFPAVEWVAYFKNTGSTDTPVIADIQPLNILLPISPNQSCQVHHARGSQVRIDDFEPLQTPLEPSGELRLASQLGCSSNGTLPFFNLELSDEGVIGAVGWTGDWAVEFRRTEDDDVRVRAGMQKTHLKLLPGEEIRTPRILLLFWAGDRLHGHNMLRQFLLAHHTPRPEDKLLQAPICYAVWGERKAAQQIATARWLRDNRIDVDYFWIDAGWYGDAPFREDSTLFNSDYSQQVGNWWPNKIAYPDGLSPVGEALRELDLGFLLWVEPERAVSGTQLVQEHPEWFLGPLFGNTYLLNLGMPAAREGITDVISSLISEAGITCYRQDFNMGPAPYWEAADPPDRVGMSEIRHIEGLYAFWDELLARHPGLIIDNCSSGGRRIDLETISRSIPLWRSDFQCIPDFDPIGMQGQTHGLSLWVPLSAGCFDRSDTYACRSALGAGIVKSFQELDISDVEWLRQIISEERQVRKYFYGDFYPLLSFSLAADGWAAWQFDRPDLSEGMVLALRRPASPFTEMRAVLRGLDPETSYEVRAIDSAEVTQISGQHLLSRGMVIQISDQPGTALFLYRRST